MNYFNGYVDGKPVTGTVMSNQEFGLGIGLMMILSVLGLLAYGLFLGAGVVVGALGVAKGPLFKVLQVALCWTVLHVGWKFRRPLLLGLKVLLACALGCLTVSLYVNWLFSP